MQAMRSLAVWVEDDAYWPASQALAEQLGLAVWGKEALPRDEALKQLLCFRQGSLLLLDADSPTKGGLRVEVDPRPGEQHSYPAPKKDLLAHAVGKKTKTVVDATTGWAQDSLALFRMGYSLQCIERSPLMAVLIADGFSRLAQKDWMKQRGLQPPPLHHGDAIALLTQLPEPPDCIYLDPMFPTKRKKSALPKKAMTVLRELLGDDLDRDALFAAAWQATGKRVVVKSPDYAEPMGGKPSECYQGKLLRYDVYLK